ncbi:hypothetical protein [Streptomyces sp. NPDC086147]|uniref:hypothetical protein n=1 Tax=Streptomyces sp. NPDC086147 TaxID=3155295 RepID=UPI00344C4842
MDPVSIGLLAALAGGVGGELGRQSWAGLSALVRRPFSRGAGEQAPAVSTGEVELVRLSEEPNDQGRAQELSTALALRAAVDTDFRAGLAAWQQQAAALQDQDGVVLNSITGGTLHGPVLQGKDFSGSFTFGTPPAPPASPTSEGGPAGTTP